MYGKFVNGILYVVNEQTAGYKPFVFTEAPTAEEGYHAAFYWKEKTNSIEQTWEIVPVVDEIDDTEAFEIIFGGES